MQEHQDTKSNRCIGCRYRTPHEFGGEGILCFQKNEVEYRCPTCKNIWWSPSPEVQIICPKCGELGEWTKGVKDGKCPTWIVRNAIELGGLKGVMARSKNGKYTDEQFLEAVRL